MIAMNCFTEWLKRKREFDNLKFLLVIYNGKTKGLYEEINVECTRANDARFIVKWLCDGFHCQRRISNKLTHHWETVVGFVIIFLNYFLK
jgi:hypothetical protein